jgi:hypothetical protein
MELDDLKSAWQTLDRRLEQNNALNLHLFKENRIDKAKSGLRPLAFGQGVQLAIGVLMTALFAPFWVRHIDTPHLAIYGLSLHAYALMFIVFAARDLFMLGGIHYDAPVLEIQKRLVELRAWRIRSGLWFAIAGCFAWTPLALVVFYWLGADIWIHAPSVVYGFIASSFACLALLYALVRVSRRPGREKLARSLEASSVGRSLSRAQAMLDEIAQFERD